MSCPDGDAGSCWLDRGDLLVMDGQCQDEFLHCTEAGLEQERINVTFRWIRRHVDWQRVRRVHPLLLRRLWRKARFVDSWCT